jgi:hypothetical protein
MDYPREWIEWALGAHQGYDVRLFGMDSLGNPYSKGWFFWNPQSCIHEKYTMQDFRDWGFTVDEMRALVLDLPKVMI